MGAPAFRLQKTTGLSSELDPWGILPPGDLSPSGMLRTSLSSNLKLRLNTFEGDPETLTFHYHRHARAEKLRKEIVRIALEEWDYWQKDHGRGETPFEDDGHEGSERVKKYWKVVGQSYSTKAELKKYPWSAAFISYVMKKAGARRDFRRAQKHTTYFYHAKQARRKRYGPLFKAYPSSGPGAVSPEVGDVIANEREDKPRSYDKLKPSGVSHSDIVVQKFGRFIVVVGGNVPISGTATRSTVVGKKFIMLGTDGLLQEQKIMFPDRTLSEDPIKYFSVMKIEAITSNPLKPGAKR